MDNASAQGSEVKKPRRKPERTPNNGIWNHAILAIGVGAFRIGLKTVASTRTSPFIKNTANAAIIPPVN